MVVPPYTANQFYDDLMRVTEGRSDIDMAEFLVQRSRPTIVWMKNQGLRWILMFARQSYQVEGKHHFWGGLNVEAVGGGAGLVEMLLERVHVAGTRNLDAVRRAEVVVVLQAVEDRDRARAGRRDRRGRRTGPADGNLRDRSWLARADRGSAHRLRGGKAAGAGAGASPRGGAGPAAWPAGARGAPVHSRAAAV